MKKLFGILLVATMLLSISCTENSRVKNFGGTGDITLQPDTKLVLVTWKDDNLWILTEAMPVDYNPKSYKLFEKSSWGMIEGTYNIYESRSTPIEVPKKDSVPTIDYERLLNK